MPVIHALDSKHHSPCASGRSAISCCSTLSFRSFRRLLESMHTTQSFIWLFSISILLAANAQWFIIKKDFPSNLMNYPNPGKRNLPDRRSTSVAADCSMPYSHLHSHRQKALWLLVCADRESPVRAFGSSSWRADSLADELSSPTSRLILHEKRFARARASYIQENDKLFHRFMMKLLRQTSKNKQK